MISNIRLQPKKLQNIKDEMKMGFLIAFISIFSSFFIIGIYELFNYRKFTPVVKEKCVDNVCSVSITIPSIFSIIFGVISSFSIYKLSKRSLVFYDRSIENELRENEKIDPEFPLISTTSILAQKVE